jgi:peptidoglycan hydrolase-like protein with peptidoglycan-binding domain
MKGGHGLKKDLLLKSVMAVLLSVIGSGMLSSGVEAATLRVGDRGFDVTVLQDKLTSMGYKVGASDGTFGKQTEQAVKALQADRGMQADGIVGDDTWSILRAANTTVSRGLTDGTLVNRTLLMAKRYLGVPYVWGGTTPKGFDCSGFTQYVFGMNGIDLPRTADLQFEMGVSVRPDQLQPGDLVYFSTYLPGPSHSGIYLGEGKFISATSSRGIAIDRLSSSYWGPRYVGAKRVLC